MLRPMRETRVLQCFRALPCVGMLLASAACSGASHTDGGAGEPDAVMGEGDAAEGGVDSAIGDPDCHSEGDLGGPELRLAIDAADLGLPPPDTGSAPVRVGLFFGTGREARDLDGLRAEATAQARALAVTTNEILAQCAIHLDIEAVQVVALPARLLDIQGNAEGSWGGHPPPGTENEDLFNYEQNEALTEETRELFGYGKEHTSDNAIAAFTVRHIDYWAEQVPTAAGGLSFPPSIYHRVEDYPFRNSVLLVPAYRGCDVLHDPPRDATLAHELGHMLLDTGTHEADSANLMSSYGTELRTDQCERMNANLVSLFGDEAVPDPGPPS